MFYSASAEDWYVVISLAVETSVSSLLIPFAYISDSFRVIHTMLIRPLQECP